MIIQLDGDIVKMQRRGGISLDHSDKSAIYVRMLGDVRMRDYHDSLQQQRNALLQKDLKALQNLAHPMYKVKCSQRFLTMHGLRRRRRQSICPSGPTSPGRGGSPATMLVSSEVKDTKSVGARHLLDDFYNVQAQCLLKHGGSWGFNIFELDKSTGGRSLSYLTLHLFKKYGLIDHFKLDIVKVLKFASMVEEGYHQNPYHNAIHAADVVQAMHCFMSEPKIAQHMTQIERLSCIVAAITHDIDHPGVNQAFLVATANHLASLYDNRSVLENHHWRTGLSALKESGMIDHLDEDTRRAAYAQLTELIMATDMSRQQEFFCRLKVHNEKRDIDMSLYEHRHFILQMALKCADINNPARAWNVCKIWSDRVCQEFYQQGDFEKKLGLPVTNNCDRKVYSIKKIQIGFISLVVQPLFKEWHKFLNSRLTANQVDNVAKNFAMWESLKDFEPAPNYIPASTEAREAVPIFDSSVEEAGSIGCPAVSNDDTVDGDIAAIASYSSSALLAMAASNRWPKKDDAVNANLPFLKDRPSGGVQRGEDTTTTKGVVATRAGQPLSMVDKLLPLMSEERRHSLPDTNELAYSSLNVRRESFPSENSGPNYIEAFEKLVDRLRLRDEYGGGVGGSNNNLEGSPASGRSSPLTVETMVRRPRISSLCPGVDTNRIHMLMSKKVEVK